MNRYLKCVVALGATWLLASTGRAAVNETFENTSDLSTNFTVGSSQGGSFTNTSTATTGNYSTRPVIGTNAIAPVGDGSATYSPTQFALASGSSITESIYVNETQATSGSQVLVELGFATQATDPFNNGMTGSFISAFSRLYSTNNTQFTIRNDSKSSVTAVAGENTSSTVTLNGSTASPLFYLYSLTLSRSGTNFTLNTTVSLVGTNPANTPTAVTNGNFSSTFTNALLASGFDAGTVYAGFRSNASGGANTLDNFSVSDAFTPEPASLGVLSLGALVLVRRRRN